MMKTTTTIRVKDVQIGNIVSISIASKQVSARIKFIDEVPVYSDREKQPEGFSNFKVVTLEDWTYVSGRTKTFIPKGTIEYRLINRNCIFNLNYTLHTN